MKYLTRKNLKSRKNKSRKVKGGIKTSSLLPTLSTVFLRNPQLQPYNIHNRITHSIYLPTSASGGNGIIPPNNFFTKADFHDSDSPNKKNKKNSKPMTEAEIVQKLGVKKDIFERFLKAERESAKNEKKEKRMEKIRKMNRNKTI